MKEQIAKATAQAIKEITLKDIYDAIGQVKQRQEEDFRYLTQRIDNLGQRIDNFGQRMDSLSQRVDTKIDQLSQRLDTKIDQVSQRLDTIMQILVDIVKQKS